MAIVTFKYDGKFGRAARGSGAIVTHELTSLGKELKTWVQDNTRRDSGESRKRTVSYLTGHSTQQTLHVEGQAPQSLYTQQTGRKPGGKQPPPENLLAWVRRKGLRANNPRTRSIRSRGFVGRPSKQAQRQSVANARILARRRDVLRQKVSRLRPTKLLSEQRSIAYLIGRAIKRRGIKAPRLFTRVLFVKRGAILKTLASISRGIADLINR